MKVTFLLPPVSLSGGIRVVVIYAQWLSSHGHSVLLISPPSPRIPLRRKLRSFLGGRGWPSSPEAEPSHLDGSGLHHLILDRYRAPSDADVPDGDVLISTWWETAEWSMNLSESKGVRIYFVQGHEIFPYLPSDRVEATYRLPMHKIAVARWLKTLMSNQYGDSVCDVVPNSVDKQLFSARCRSKQAAPTVGFLVSEMLLKGLDVALTVLSVVRCTFPRLKVRCFGSHVGQQTSQLLAANGFEFSASPSQTAIRDIYASCDVWLSTSKSEGFNLTAIEAMACCTPVVSTRTGWPEEVIKDGWNGYLAGIDDIQSLATRVIDVLSLENAEWSLMSHNALQTVSDSSWDASSNLFESALKNAVERARLGEIYGRPTSGW